jgi:hypothetical protein
MEQACGWNSVKLTAAKFASRLMPCVMHSMSFLLRIFSAGALLFTLSACGWGDPGFVRLGEYECEAGEAVVRHLIQTAPDLAPAVPKEYCIVKSRSLAPVVKEFNEHFADMKKVFVSSEGLSFNELGYPVNPRSGLAPIVLHLVHMHLETDKSYTVEAAWAYKMAFERHKFQVKPVNGSWEVKVLEKLAGSDGKPLGGE